jgi:DNA-binding MarR family transcriptional regulator
LKDPDLSEVADGWLQARRRFEAAAGSSVPAEDREALRDLTVEQLAVLARVPADGLDETEAPERIALAEGRYQPAIEDMIEAGLVVRETGPGGAPRIALSPTGRKSRATLDTMQRASLTAMVRAAGPELSRRLVEVLEAALGDGA